MKLTLSHLKKIVDLELNPEETPIVYIPFCPTDNPLVTKPFGSINITPYIVILTWNFEIQDWESNLKI